MCLVCSAIWAIGLRLRRPHLLGQTPCFPIAIHRTQVITTRLGGQTMKNTKPGGSEPLGFVFFIAQLTRRPTNNNIATKRWGHEEAMNKYESRWLRATGFRICSSLNLPVVPDRICQAAPEQSTREIVAKSDASFYRPPIAHRLSKITGYGPDRKSRSDGVVSSSSSKLSDEQLRDRVALSHLDFVIVHRLIVAACNDPSAQPMFRSIHFEIVIGMLDLRSGP